MPGFLGKINCFNKDTSRERLPIENLVYHKKRSKVYSDSNDDLEIALISEIAEHVKIAHEDGANKRSIYYYGETFGKSDHIEKDILTAQRLGSLDTFLSELDRIFSAVIVDRKEQKLYLISDRLGQRPMYYYSSNSDFQFATELKGLFFLSGDEFKIDKRAINCFLDTGQLIGNCTWFEECKLMDAASIVTIDLRSKVISSKRYWSWSQVKVNSDGFNQAVSNIHDLFQAAVQSRIKSGSYALSLSGGLDSRCILAFCKEKLSASYSFGTQDSEDVIVAEKLSTSYQIPHHIFNLDEKNWFSNRVEGVWKTDGMMNIKHLHASAFQEELAQLNHIHLHGCGGNVIFGACWNKKLNTRISKESGFAFYGKHIDLVNLQDSFYDIEKEDPFYLDTRLRRFSRLALLEPEVSMAFKIPFLDKNLIEYILSLPDEYRVDNRLYRAFFKLLPKEISKVKNANTGISPVSRFRTVDMLKLKVSSKFYKRERKFTDYNSWLGKSKELIVKAIESKDNNIAKILGRKIEINSDEMLFKLLTLEIYFELLSRENSSFINYIKGILTSER